MTLAELLLSFGSDIYSVEAWDFQNPDTNGDFPGLFVPSRKLVRTGTGSVPIQNGPGQWGRGAYQPAGCDQYLAVAADDSYNCLAAAYDWLGCSVWWRGGDDVFAPKLGVYGAAGARQWLGELNSGNQVVQVFNSSDIGPDYAGINAAPNNSWNHAFLQVHYDGVTTGVELRLQVNGVDYSDLTGSLAITPTAAASLGNFTLGFVNGNQSEDVTWDSLVLLKSATGPIDPEIIAGLFAGGNGIDLVPRGANPLLRFVGSGII